MRNPREAGSWHLIYRGLPFDMVSTKGFTIQVIDQTFNLAGIAIGHRKVVYDD
jgi:hypothetical protein